MALLPCCMAFTPLLALIASGLIAGACFNLGCTALQNRCCPRSSVTKPGPCRQRNGPKGRPRMRSAAAGTEKECRGTRERGSRGCSRHSSHKAVTTQSRKHCALNVQKSSHVYRVKPTTMYKDKGTETSYTSNRNRAPTTNAEDHLASYGYIRAKKTRDSGVKIKRNKFGCEIEY